MDRCFLVCGLIWTPSGLFLLLTNLTIITSSMGFFRPLFGIALLLIGIIFFVMSRLTYLNFSSPHPGS